VAGCWQVGQVVIGPPYRRHPTTSQTRSRGDSYDNALAETVVGLYKTELIRRRGPWRTLEHLELATAEWVGWWNHRRLHGAAGDVPPAEYEELYYRQRDTSGVA
jgi:transposase InsO family protein